MKKKAQDLKKEIAHLFGVDEEKMYLVKEHNVPTMDRLRKSFELNTVFAGTLHLDCWNCAYSDEPEMEDSLSEEDIDLINEFIALLEPEMPNPN